MIGVSEQEVRRTVEAIRQFGITDDQIQPWLRRHIVDLCVMAWKLRTELTDAERHLNALKGQDHD